MAKLRVNWSRDEAGQENLSVYYAGQNYTANNTHPAWDELLVKAMDDDESVVDLFDIGMAVGKRLALSDRVSYAKGYLFLDGDRLSDGLADHIVRMVQADEDVQPFVLLLENILQNPSANSRAQLYRYIDRHHITITRDGHLVLYKYVYRNKDEKVTRVDNGEVASYVSGNAGPAFVNGAPHKAGKVPQGIGDVVSMPRSDVADNPSVACSNGLHVGAWEYISSYECKLEIEVHPRDVVSVPSDSSERKVRVCRYKIIGELKEPYTVPVKPEPEVPELTIDDIPDRPVEPIEEPVLQPVDPSGGSGDTSSAEPEIKDPFAEKPKPVKHPTQKEFDLARVRAKLQKKSLQAYVEKRMKWRYVGGEGGDLKSRKSWSTK